MANDQNPQLNAQTEEYEPVLVIGMLWVRNNPSVLVQERCPSFLEGDTVLSFVGATFPRIPLEADVGHADSVTTT
jgi:hypothetical protein